MHPVVLIDEPANVNVAARTQDCECVTALVTKGLRGSAGARERPQPFQLRRYQHRVATHVAVQKAGKPAAIVKPLVVFEPDMQAVLEKPQNVPVQRDAPWSARWVIKSPCELHAERFERQFCVLQPKPITSA